jgi:RNA polymerase sigma-70 factor (ECF subfamily)
VEHAIIEALPYIYRFALRISGNPQIAEDMTQEAVLRAIQRNGTDRQPNDLRPWLFQVVCNLWRDRCRERKRADAAKTIIESLPQHDTADPLQRISQSEEVNRVLEIMMTLPERQRMVLHLIACEEMSIAEVATILGLNKNAVKASLAEARKKMRSLASPTIHCEKNSSL